jgi:uncharacterized protein YuzE
MKWVFDAEADAAILRFSDEPVDGSEEVADGIVLDFAADGRLLGIEVLKASVRLPAEALRPSDPAIAAE